MFATIAALIPAYLINFIVQFVLLISNIALAISVWFLEWTMSENFIRISYTQMTGTYANPIIGVGWPLLRDLVNMGFLVMIIFIGIATSLRIQEYQAQKTLVPLIFIAILINFTPVIIGVIVDASNILMNFFLDGVSGLKTFQSHLGAQVSIVVNLIKGFTNPLTVITSIFKATFLTVFNFISAAIFAIFAFLFIVRHLAIWILVILSPVVFASYIFPSTRSFWSSWWRQLFQWCFIGVTAGFFLYLANQLIVNSAKLNISAPPSGGAVESFIATLVPYMISLAFLLFGLMTGFSTSAMGAGAVINFTKKNASRLGKFAQTKTASTLRGIPVVSRAEGKLMRTMEGIPLVGGAFGGRGAYDKRLAGRADAAKSEIDQMSMAPNGTKSIQRVAAGIGKTDRGITGKRVAAIRYLAQKGKLPTDPAELANVKGAVEKAAKIGFDMDDVYNVHPTWANDPAEIEKQVKNIPADKFADIDAAELDNENVVKGLKEKQIARLTDGGTAAQRNAIIKRIQAMTGFPTATPFPNNLDPALPPIHGVSRAVINYIGLQQSHTPPKWAII